jgi:hypothetical protein
MSSDQIIVALKFNDGTILETDKDIVTQSKMVKDAVDLALGENDDRVEVEINTVKPEVMKQIYDFMT